MGILYQQRAVRPGLVGGGLISEFYELIFPKKDGFYPYTSYFFKKLTKMTAHFSYHQANRVAVRYFSEFGIEFFKCLPKLWANGVCMQLALNPVTHLHIK